MEIKPIELDDNTVLLTIFLKHHQTMNLNEIGEKLKKSEFWKNFPPDGIEVASWYVMMGIGQVVTLKVPASRLRDVNLAIERGAWGAFSTEFYATYDFIPAWKTFREQAK
jgi:hypothetical protein